ncbi:DNA-directed RNA polymerase sigma-70 factor [Actinorhabdospora filicis]|uniref:DNA-directed RNA polymerase sigma-70 factor n=1 Tax=Actinorhabdospora filicis TaxID=1785913 RepID=A0A9W6SSR9_9ACTN|nr:sigma-70 family RNA polymerase sigma factor [Actinorhabdospora filicis]GLZ81294.1 DNA-directed RNA polymerase sigma-70 factor [Actinorhabdospora filicis]
MSAEVFEQQRDRLTAIALRMLGTRADAEDAVQETWLRLARQDASAIGNLPAWLTTVVGRVCLDALRSRASHPAAPLEGVDAATGEAVEDDAVRAESVGLAMGVVLDALAPTERMAFVLHDMFAVPFEEVGHIVGKSTAATKMLTSRARRKVRELDRPQERVEHREVVDAFLAASREGDFEGLLRLLDPDVVLHEHMPRGVVVKLGATEIAARAVRGARMAFVVWPALVDGVPGLVAWTLDGRPLATVTYTVESGRITRIDSIVNPARLRGLA